jgi:predicted RNA-binding protein with RPS1 domain
MQLRGEVIRIEPFGAFVEVGADRPGLVHVSEISDEYVRDPRDQIRVGEELAVTVLEVDRKKKQIRLSLKAAQPAEELEPEEEQQLPTAMELALRQALEASPPNRIAGKPKAKADQHRSELEDILARTLSSRLRTSSGESEESK